VGGCAFVIASLFVLRFARLAVKPLEESARKQKQFVSDAGHELKTPLSVIATNMDILEVDLADQPDELEWIDSTNRQVTNMRRLVNDLIVLSKMEEREDDVVLCDVSLSDTAFECIQTFSQIAIAQGKELVPSIDEGVRVRGDEPAIRQLMQILVDNAIKYAMGDGTILVEVAKAGRTVSFATRNDWAHDVESRELPTLFDRFVRGEQSRDRSGGKAGYGLGLSIARAIAEKNDIKLEVGEDDAGRIMFRALFPAR
jgi:signal transduction histidine kinase